MTQGDVVRLLQSARPEAQFSRRGLLLVLSSPSGAGKSSLARALLASDSDIRLSVSATTRPIRPGETEGKDYFFMSRAEFLAQVDSGAMLEWAEVFGNCYGTPRAPVEAWTAQGLDVLFDIDWQGARQLRASAGAAVADVFILPPSLEELERRLTQRGQDSAEVIRHRMSRAEAEMSHWGEYSYLVVNEDFDASLRKLSAILLAERLKRFRQTGLNAHLEETLAERGFRALQTPRAAPEAAAPLG